MRFSAAILGAAVLLSGVHSANAAAQAVTSKLTFALQMQVTTPFGTDSDTKITRIRFGTKDLMTFASTATAGTVKSLALQRTSVVADTLPATAPVLSQTIVLLDSTGTPIVETDAIVQAALDLTDLGGSTQLVQAVNTAGAETFTTVATRRRDLISEGGHFVLDANNDATAQTTDQIEIDLLGLTATATKRGKDPADKSDAGQFFTSRASKVFGGMHIDSGVLGQTADTDGIVTGTYSAAAEKIQ